MNVLKAAKKATLITLLKHEISQHEISRKAKIDFGECRFRISGRGYNGHRLE